MIRSARIVLNYDPDSDPDEGSAVEFRLIYEGVLLGASRTNTRASHKHEIRKVFHRQLQRLWAIHPFLVEVRNLPSFVAGYDRCGYNFIPLVTREHSLLCSLDILFLRPDQPGDVLQSGDIDNRIKTIFDALRLPSSTHELGDHLVPSDGETPFFCLLEDDKLITHLSVETDTLLQPLAEEFEPNDARLVVHVKIKPYLVTMDNSGFG